MINVHLFFLTCTLFHSINALIINKSPFLSQKSNLWLENVNNSNLSVSRQYAHNEVNLSRRDWFQSSTVSTSIAAFVACFAQADNAVAFDESAPLCEPTVSIFKKDGRMVYLVGTAHISDDSAKLVGKIVQDVKPDAVFVELDAKRVKMGMKNSDDNSVDAVKRKSEELDPAAALPKKPSPFDLKARAVQAGSQAVGKLISGLYKKLESQGFSAGEEFVIAIKEGLALSPPATIILGDRDVDITLQRLTEALSKTDIKQLFAAEDLTSFEAKLPDNVKSQLDAGQDLSKEQMTVFVETLKQKETVKQLMNRLKATSPEVYMAMVGERDVYMANGLNQLSNIKCTVAVMGLAHVDGVERCLKEEGWTPAPVACKSAAPALV